MYQKMNMMVESANTINFCGKPIHSITGQVYQAPFKVEPTTGNKHDYTTCEGCRENYKRDLEAAKRKFALFPDCCDNHRKLKDKPFFKLEEYAGFPGYYAEKVMFSKNHIINNIDKEDWYIEITNYLDYVIKSFGQTPQDCGEPLMVSTYINLVTQYLKDNAKAFKAGKAEKIIGFFEHYYEPVNKRETDLNILVGTYQKWLNIFPFDLSIFSQLKEHFESTLPILKDTPIYNPYLKAHRAQLLDKDSLIEFLVNQTDHLLKQINTLKLYESGDLTDIDKLKFDMIIESRKLKIGKGYNNQSKNEETRYRKMIKEWFEDERRFIDEITPFLKKQTSKADNSPEAKLRINQIALIHVYNGEQITRQNADEIAARYGYNSKNSGEGLFQDFITYSSPANRRGKPIPCTPKKLRNKIELFESVSKYLTGRPLSLLNDEIRLLRTIFENEYE